MIFLLILGFLFPILLEVPVLVRGKSWKELAVYSLFMSLAFIVCLTEILHIEIWNPVKDTQYFFERLFHPR